MEQIEFQEPCCIERNLPRLLTPGKVLVWHTNGDILFSHIMKSLACLAGNALHVTIATPVLDMPMINDLMWYQRNGWLKQLTVLTSIDQSGLINGAFPVDFHRAAYNHKSIDSSLLLIEGEQNTVVVQGPLHGKITGFLESFTSYRGSDPDQVNQFAAPVRSRISMLQKAAARKKK